MATTSQPRSRRAGHRFSAEKGHACSGRCHQSISADDRVIIETLEEFYVPTQRYMVFHVHCHPRVVERRFASLAKRH